jgi:hypothetical protein
LANPKTRRLRWLDIVVVVLGVGFAWSVAAKHDYEGGWLVFAIAMTALFAAGLVRRLR